MISDLDFVQNPNLWYYDHCCLVGLCGNPRQTGILIGDGPKVYIGNVFKGIDLITCEKVSYPSFKELLQHWRVD